MAATLGEAVWSVGVGHLWQSTAFALGVWLVLRLVPRAPARLRHGCVFLTSVKFLLPAAWIGALGLGVPAVGWLALVLPAAVEPWLSALAAGPSALAAPPSLPWRAALAAVWALGAAVLLTGWRLRRRELAVRVARGSEPSSGREVRMLERLRRRLGLGRRVRLVVSPEVAEPAVWGIVRPVVMLPRGLSPRLSDPELEAVLLHELLHVARWDNLTALGQRLLTCLFWFHPLAWWLERRLAAERELACDEQVVARVAEPRAYARGLLEVVRLGIGLPPRARAAAVPAATGGALEARLERILQPAAPAWPRSAERTCLALAALALVLFTLVAAYASAPSDGLSRHSRACGARTSDEISSSFLSRHHPPQDT